MYDGIVAHIDPHMAAVTDDIASFEGFPIALVTAGLMALAFMGFSGLKIW